MKTLSRSSNFNSKSKTSGIFFFAIFFFLFNINLDAQNIAITDDGSYTADESAMLDIKSESKGLLIPRISDFLTVDSPATGLLIYYTENDIGPGFYYNAGTPGSPDWEKLNAGTITLSEIVDSDDGDTKVICNVGDRIFFNINDARAMTIQNDLNVGIGTDSPDCELEVAGQVKITGGSPGTDKVLTSDADGLATWETIAAGATDIDDLSDASSDGYSIFLGENAGSNDDGSNQNTAIGIDALESNTSGEYNVANGYRALYSNAGNSRSTAIGYYAMRYADNRSSGRETYNTAIGDNALRGSSTSADNTGRYNTAIGFSTLLGNTSGSNNTAIGSSSMENNTTGYQNTAIGSQALNGNNIGNNNTAIGDMALRFNEEGLGNTALGTLSLYSNKNNDYNTAIGYQAIYNANDGNLGSTYNTAIGYQALYSSTTPSNNTGSQNTTVGAQTLKNNTSGNKNCAFGTWALEDNTTGSENVSIGQYSMYDNTTGSYNVAIGRGALGKNDANSSSTAIGYQAMYYADDRTSGRETYNTAVGFQALYGSSTAANNTGRFNTGTGYESLTNITSGDRNTAYGYRSLHSLNTGEYNLGIGYQAGDNITIGNYNTFVGNLANADANNYINATVVGYAASATASNHVRLGNENISSFYCMGAYVGQIGSTNRDLCVDNTGKIGYIPSSIRYKTAVVNMENVSWIYNLRPVNYIYKNDDTKSKQYGLIAEEVEKINPSFVFYNDEGLVESVSYSNLITPMLKAMQEQQETIEMLEAKIEALKTSNRNQQVLNISLESRIDKLESLLTQQANK